MNCASCGRANRAGARFCGGCGASLAPRCPACGAEASPDARFCDACGASLAARPSDAAVARKVVTIVFADLIGSTALHERLDPEAVRRVMEAYHGAVRTPVEAHGGTVVQLLGDGVMCAFGVPRVAEDDAIRAVRAAADVQRAFRDFVREHPELEGRVGLRVAVNTGEVVVSDDYAAGIGDPLNVAARLQQEAKDGDVLIGEATQRLVADQVTLAPVGSFALKGRAERVAAYRVVSLERPARAAAAAFVGRDAELRRLGAVYEAACAAQQAKLAVVLGSPGLGKSRLLSEFARELGGRATVLTAQCVASGGATFSPLAEALRTAQGTAVIADEAEHARLEAGIGAILAGAPASPEETFFAVRRLLGSLATAQPVVLVIDDLHWAEPLLLDLVEHLVQWGAGSRLLVLAGARPELRDTRSSLTMPGGLAADVVTLGGLDASAATRLAAAVIGADALPAAVAGRVLATSEGNPLFLGELVRMLVNDGALRQEGDRWVTAVALADLEMPPTIQALLAARIERLRAEDRLVLERASVVGRSFSRAAVAHLLPREAQADLDARLESLRRSELIEPDSGWFLGEPALRFHHVLFRDAAYRRLLRNTRADLHGRFAEWLSARAGGDSAQHGETIGWHLEQAFQHLRELGTLDTNARELGTRAARHLADAGRRALARDDLPPAGSLLGRALDCLDAADPTRAELALDWCEALLAAGEVAAAARALAELGRFAPASERVRAWHTCFSGQLAVLSDTQALHASAEAVAAAAETLVAAGDAAGEAKAHSVHALVLAQLGRIGACEAALDRALAAARRARDRRRANAVLAGAPVAALWGPSPVTRASGRCLDVVRVLRITQGAPAVEAVALRCQAVLETLRGRSEAARRMIASSRQMVEELGITQRVLEADVFAGLIELLEGDGVAAEQQLRPAYAGLCAQGLGIDAAQAAALLGRALLAQGRVPEAEALSHESEALAGDSFKAAIAWRGVRAEALAARGEHEAALDVARKAVEIAAATDDLLDHADARQSLAVALRAAGRRSEADAEERRAIELWEQKGATLLVERAQREAGRAAPVERDPAAQVAPAESKRLRRVRPNAATANADRLDAAVAARDADMIASVLGDLVETADHTTGVTYDRAAALAQLSILGARDLAFQHEHLAVLGDSLALSRQVVSHSGFTYDSGVDVGAVEHRRIVLIEVDPQGRRFRSEIFAADRLGHAIARLYERYAELVPEGPEHERAATTARGVAALLKPWELDSVGAILAPDLEFFDRRTLGIGSWRGAEAFLNGVRATVDLTSERANRTDDVIDLRPGALLVRRTNSGIGRVSGGEYERILFALHVFGSDGRLTHLEQFDVDREEDALARFDELTAERAPSIARRVRANAATANAARLDAAIAARDVVAIAGVYAEATETVHHPTGTRYDREGALRSLHMLVESPTATYRQEPLATLGDALALCRTTTFFRGASFDTFDVGAAEREGVALLEVDAHGRRSRSEVFAPDRLGDAIARLWARYAELLPEGAARDRAETTARTIAIQLRLDDAPIEDLLAPEIEFADHRPLGMGRSRGAAAYLRGREAQRELEQDLEVHVHEILALEPAAVLMRWTTSGAERSGGGPFERNLLMLWAYAEDGRLARVEWFESGRDAEALARLAALAPEPSPVPRIENAATRALARFNEGWEARDWARVAASYGLGFQQIDRRALMHLELDREGHLESLRIVFATSSSHYTTEVLATRGDRLVLARWHLAISDRSAGPSEVDFLAVTEVDADGARSLAVLFDPDARDAAFAELDARYTAGEAAAHSSVSATMQAFLAAFAARDWDALAALFAERLVVHDHRRLGWETLRGPAAYVQSLRSLVELAPDARLRLDHVRMSARGLLWVAGWVGTREGGPFEAPWITVSEHDARGEVHRFDQYDLDQLDEARARFAAVSASVPHDPLAAFAQPNAASAAMDRAQAAFEAHDWAAMRAAYAAEARIDDRRRHVLVSYDADGWVADTQRIVRDASIRYERRLVASAGQRVALERVLWTGDGPDAGRLEVEYLFLVEVEETGHIVAGICFDLDDRRASQREARRRWFARYPEAAAVAGPHYEFIEALSSHVPPRVRAAVAENFVLHDRRRAGMGLVEGVDAYLETLAVLWELAPDIEYEAPFPLALERHGLVVAERGFGTLREGGAFERPLVTVSTVARGRLTRLELFEIEDVAAALARFRELRPDPLRIPPNAATRTSDQLGEAFRAADWPALRALAGPDFKFEDRRKRSLVSGDIDLYIRNLEIVRGYPGLRTTGELLATVGDRIQLERLPYRGGEEGSAFEGEFLRLCEVDAERRLRAVLHFDPEDRSAAFGEANARFVAGEAAGDEGQAAIAALGRAVGRRDWKAVRDCCTDDFATQDHRRLGLSSFGVDDYVESLRALTDLAPDVAPGSGCILAWSRHGRVFLTRTIGTRDGGAFETVTLIVAETRGARIRRIEVFDPADADRALARFEELCTQAPPDAAVR